MPTQSGLAAAYSPTDVEFQPAKRDSKTPAKHDILAVLGWKILF
jgi:hypothetical protein